MPPIFQFFPAHGGHPFTLVAGMRLFFQNNGCILRYLSQPSVISLSAFVYHRITTGHEIWMESSNGFYYLCSGPIVFQSWLSDETSLVIDALTRLQRWARRRIMRALLGPLCTFVRASTLPRDILDCIIRCCLIKAAPSPS